MAEPQNGRIGGGVLKDNLLRQGVDLKFANTQASITADTPLLHLDVNSQKINIKSVSSVDTLNVPDNIRSTNLKSTYLNVANLTIDTSSITSLSGNLNLNAANNIFATSVASDNLKIDFNTISSTTENSNIEIRPDGTGTLDIRSNWNITGALNATGDITFGGNLTLGDTGQDNVDFEADVSSDLIPNQSNIVSLGSSSKRWQNLYSNLLNGQQVTVDEFEVNDASLARRQGNIFYVSTLGDNTNVGDHQHGAFRTLKHALEVSDASLQGPVTIHIFPGEYEEEFPLTVPPHVTVHGEDIRNVIIKPTVATQDQDAFLIEGDVTVENITIKDFYYNAVTNTGHAFRFTPNGLVSTRSPYIRNITVITKGSNSYESVTDVYDASGATDETITDTFDGGDASTESESILEGFLEIIDPRGFDTGDAGKGALIDGNELDGDSLEASMLFHSCTFITPGVDAITMTNGVRVEWLNSFTYFANRGLYATQGSEGKIMPDSTTRFGAEIRSIGSANVYGNYGAVADGANTLMYLIGHNFAYIGTGKDVTNDGTLVVQNNEVVEINFGKIYYNSTDAFGTYRIGNQFFADFETGSTSINAETVDFSGISSILVNTAGLITYIDGERIDTGNIRISGNTIENIAEDLEISPYTEILDLASNPQFIVSNGSDLQRTDFEANFRYNTDIDQYEGYSSANISFGGIYSDDKETSIDATNNSNELIIRSENNEVGRIVDSGLQIHGLYNEDILFDDNTINTTTSNSELELVRSGNAVVDIFDFDVNDSFIKNKTNNAFVIESTDRGYVKFDASTGIIIPVGDTLSRPVAPVTGNTRWNTDDQILETYNGTAWQRSAGEGEEVTDEVLKELVDIYTLVLG